jgi:hypothetical protein
MNTSTPRKLPQSTRRQNVRAACAQLGVTILPLEAGGFRLYGRGVDLKVTDLCYVDLRDLREGAFEEERRGRA